MNLQSLLPILIVLTPLLAGILIFQVPEHRFWLRKAINFSGNILCLVFIALLLNGVYNGEVYETRLPLLPDIDLVLHADSLSLLFVSLSGVLWLLTSFYATGYLEGSKNRSRFFGFFSLCVAATLGIAVAGNLITFLIFYELLTITTYPLVVHKGNAASLRAGRIYMTYTMIGGALLLAGVVWLKALAGPLDFTSTGILSAMPYLNPLHLQIIFAMIIAGLGVKAAIFPLHGWLPVAMAAPAPVSALLHAVAVVKAGAFGIIRVVYDVYGIEFSRDLGLTQVLAIFASFTIIYGSIRAVFQTDLKKRLAYSTVSQVSYIALGTAIAGPIATIGGMVHLVHQGVMKITLFFCAGNFAETLGIHKINEMQGLGRRMPISSLAFTVAALGMIGVPPIAGFVSKWFLASGAIEVESYWVLAVLAGSSLLNAIYFLPILNAIWFKPPNPDWPAAKGRLEAHWMLCFPPAITAALAIAAGVFANNFYSPLSWAELIAAREYGREFIINATNAPQQLSILPVVILAPILCLFLAIIPTLRRYVLFLNALAAIPALLVAMFAGDSSTLITSLFFGQALELNQTTRLLLFLAALLWLLAAVYSWDYLAKNDNKTRFTLFYLLCMTGSFGLTLSQDIFGFITFFTLMSLSSYGLVVFSGSNEAVQAGKTYIRWVVAGEIILFAALVGLSIHGSTNNTLNILLESQPTWVSVFLLLGFGIKAGVLGLHFWLPKAHPVAPVPASALLSGLMVKAGLIGWIRFVPFGTVALPEIGYALIAVGFAGAFLGVLIGLMQSNPKALLAYSTISQMGVITTGFGVGLINPSAWPQLSIALLVYTLHHGLAKAALFLGVALPPSLFKQDLWRYLAWAVLLTPALSLLGMPLSNGAIAKSGLKEAMQVSGFFAILLSVTTVGTTLLMLKFLFVASSTTHFALQSEKHPKWGILAMSLLAGLLLFFYHLTAYFLPNFEHPTLRVQANSLVAPITAAIVLYFTANKLIPNQKWRYLVDIFKRRVGFKSLGFSIPSSVNMPKAYSPEKSLETIKNKYSLHLMNLKNTCLNIPSQPGNSVLIVLVTLTALFFIGHISNIS